MATGASAGPFRVEHSRRAVIGHRGSLTCRGASESRVSERVSIPALRPAPRYSRARPSRARPSRVT